MNYYGVIALGNADINQHCMGNLLVQGDLSGNYNNFADSPYTVAPSYIAGYVSKPGGPNGRSKYSGIPLYVGSSNTVDGTTLNGMNWYNHDDPIIVTDNYVDWARIYEAATSEVYRIQNLSSLAPTVKPDWNWQEIEIQRGTITNLLVQGNFVKIRLTGNPTGEGTIINVLDSGTVLNPQVVGLSQGEENGGSEPICIVYPNANTVVIPTELTPEIGCVLAPYADIQINGGNTNGCLFGQNISTLAEGHMWPYQGSTRIPEPEPETQSEEPETQSEESELISEQSETQSEIIPIIETEEIVIPDTEPRQTEPVQTEQPTEIPLIETDITVIETEQPVTVIETEQPVIETEPKLVETEETDPPISELIPETQISLRETEISITEPQISITESQISLTTETETVILPTEVNVTETPTSPIPVVNNPSYVPVYIPAKETTPNETLPPEEETKKQDGGAMGESRGKKTEETHRTKKISEVKGANRDTEVAIKAATEELVVIPKTGDDSPIMRFVCALLLSFAVLVVLAYVIRNRRN